MITINLSQSALGYHGCVLEVYRTAVQGYHEVSSSNIVYGEAIHKYRHVMFQTGGHIPSAIEQAIKTFNQPKVPSPTRSSHLDDQRHMITSAHLFWDEFVTKDTNTEYVLIDGKPATEVSFSIEYYKDEWITVNLCGTIDGLAKIKNGCYIVQDLKTTSAWDKGSFFGTYKLSRQLRFYVLALRLMHQLYPNSILGQIGGTKVGARVDALFIKPSAAENKCISSDVFQYSEQEITDFQSLVDWKIQELSTAVKNNHFPKQGVINNSCIGKWGMCKFTDICSNPPEVGEILLKRDFKVREFNPLNYSGL